jgi:hypothetical protein
VPSLTPYPPAAFAARDPLVIGAAKAPQAAPAGEGRARPEDGITAPDGIEIPALAAAAIPDGNAEPFAEPRVESALDIGTNVECETPAAAMFLERGHHIARLRFDHEDLRVMGESRIRSDHHEKIRKAADGRAEIGFFAGGPRLGQAPSRTMARTRTAAISPSTRTK